MTYFKIPLKSGASQSHISGILHPVLGLEDCLERDIHWDDPEGWDGEGGGWGFRMGNTCTPMADSCQYMAKPIQYCKVKK